MSSQYSLIAGQWPELHEEALKVEQFVLSDPRTACFYARRTIELLVEWIYTNDSQLQRPVAAQTLADLMYARAFCDLASEQMARFRLLKDLGNKAVHRTDPIRAGDAVTAARELFQVLRWFALTYGRDPQRLRGCRFEVDLLPSRQATTTQQTQSREQLEALAEQLAERDAQLRDQHLASLASQEELDRLRQEITALRLANEAAAQPDPSLLEVDCRGYINHYLEEAGWAHGTSCTHEHEVQGMPNASGIGYVDYVLWGDDGRPLALVEAKRSSINPMEGQRQAELYANGLEQRYGQRPIIFLSNGYRHRLWDDLRYPPRDVQGFYKKEELQTLIRRRDIRQRAKQIRAELGNPRKILLGVDRLDYTKGIDVRLRAFSELLAEGRAKGDDTVLIQLATPSRERVDSYRILRNGAQIATTSSANFTDSSWSVSSNATYQVVAVNRSGNFTNAPAAPAPRLVWNVANNLPWDGSGEGNPLADPDADGIPNLREYFHGLDPRGANSASPFGLHGLSDGNVLLRYRRNSAATDLPFALESTSSLSSPAWASVNATETSLTGEWSGWRETAVPAGPGGAKFFRLRVGQ
jgi:hypothetical protein